jgi:hypothetical protein
MNPELLRALTRPDAYAHPIQAPVRLVETHVSWVFLTGPFAYKVKKPVKFGDVLDYRSLDQRKRLCEREVELNRPLAGNIYLSVEPIKRTGEGLRVGEKWKGAPVEWAVKTRQLPQEAILTHLVRQNRADPALFLRLAHLLNELHRKTRGKKEPGAGAALEKLREKSEENFRTARELGLEYPESYEERVRGWLARNAKVIAARAKRYAVDGHGDYHTGNVFILGADPAKADVHVTDRIEFSDLLRYQDEAEDAAFLAMDLDHLGRSDLGDAFLEEYVRLSGDQELRGVLNYYKSYRAFVRAKVHAFYAKHAQNEDARGRHLQRAREFLLLAQAYPF